MKLYFYKNIPQNHFYYQVLKSRFGKIYLIFDQEKRIYELHFLNTDTDNYFKILSEKYNNPKELKNIFEENDILIKNPIVDICIVGTEFKCKVLKNLCEIPFGKTISYSMLAMKIGTPQSFRAVASAVAKNNIGFLIPCHRIIKKSGKIGGYRWGAELKKELLNLEHNF